MHDPTGIAELGMLTGMISIAGTLAVILIIVLAQIRNRRARAEMLHKERLLAIEKGIPIPPDYLETGDNKKRRPYVGGLVWAAVGLGLLIWGIIGEDHDLNGFGLIPLFVGIALMIGDFLATKRVAHPKNDSVVYPEAPAPYRAPDNPS
ncbi:MAG TPA: DUF6249 domain-containing protein [bacterium]|jgi:hypothetical protein